jgi:mono/diheme cytochrome c family protein
MNSPSGFVVAFFATALSLSAQEPKQQKETPAMVADAAGYEAIVAPFLSAYCAKCHVGDKPKGDFGTDAKRLPNDFLDLAARGKWKEVVNVLNSHEMPPKKEKQPDAKSVAAVVDWITAQSVKAEVAKRERTIVLRRLNRDEYRNTIRDLIGIDYDVSGFPQDPPAGGFDNNGSALTVSPLHIETYLNAARQILDRAIVDGPQPKAIRWRFEPKAGDADRTRLRLDPMNNPIVNGGNNTMDGDWVVIHHNSWDKGVGSRDFRVPTAGTYIIRLEAAGTVPDRARVVASAETILAKRKADEDKRNPKGVKYHQDAYERDLEHFKTDRMYDYGSPRVKLVVQLGPQPRTIAEFDAEGTVAKPIVHEFRTRFTTETAGIHFDYAYDIPRVLENFWLQTGAAFARPELRIRRFELEGPVYDAWPPSSHRQILFDSPNKGNDDTAYAKEVLARFLKRAYRRPVTEAEVAGKLAHYTAARKDNATFNDAIKRALTSVLVSSNFLYIAEPSGAQPRPLNDHEIASRLSYFLWSTMPDETLTALADAGKLRDPATRQAQVDRMLSDPKADAFVKNFAGQWLNLRDVGANPPASDLYPQYDRHLETSIVAESEAFFREILQNDLSCRNFIKSDFVTVNERLARFYGIPGVKGDAFRKVAVPAGVARGGIVTQASILTTTSNGTRTSPVKRGTWIMKTLLGIDPGLPVANAGEIAPKVPGIDKATVRKRLEIHRELEQCARCHNKIDPLGFALENYNACGEFRLQEGFGYKGRIERNDPKIDASSTMIDGTPIVGVAGLQEAMLAREDLFLACLANKMFTYALGRELGLADQPTVNAAVARMKGEGRTLRSLIRFIVASDSFGTK